MRRRALVAAVAGWVTVVGATSAVAWFAIDRAGREVLTATSEARVDPGAVATGAPRTPRPPRTQAVPTTAATAPTSGSASGSASGAASPTTSAPRATTSSSSHTSTATTPAAPTSASSRSRTTTSAPPRPAAVDRTVRVAGGQVGVRCVGQTASLRFAQPADGWAVRVDDNGPDHVKVRFRSSGDDGEIEVEAECSDGTPAFSTSDDEHHDSDTHAGG